MNKDILVDKTTDGKMFVERYVFEEGESQYFTTGHDLFYYIISGYGLMDIESYGYSIEQGTGVLIPKGAELTVSNTGDVGLVVVVFGTK